MSHLNAIRQYREGLITYGEMMQRIMELLPPPCDDPTVDMVYRPLVEGLNQTLVKEQEAYHEIGEKETKCHECGISINLEELDLLCDECGLHRLDQMKQEPVH